MAQGTWEEADYRRSGNLDTCLADALAQALDNIPTDIQVANMGTLRKPSLHFLHDFLEKKAQRMTETTEQRLQVRTRCG